MNNQTYNKKILLSVTGMSPAVVTETLYALVTEKGFIPDEIRVITTIQGKNKLLDVLCGIVAGRKERKGALEEFIEDYGDQYGFNHIHFDESCIEIIKDEQGNELADIRSPEENEQSADQIVELVGKLCQQEDSQLHVSIAGGRKTMGFFLGYALSLYGRTQDSLSHVLVAEEFENLPSFFYPKPTKHEIMDRNGKLIDASQAKVMLAEIPWVRLGLGVSEELLNNRVSYRESIKQAQEAIEDEPSMIFLKPIEDRKIQLGSKIIPFSARGYAFLLSLSLFKQREKIYDVAHCEEEIISLYLSIYNALKNDVRMEERLRPTKKKDEIESELKVVLSESRNDVVKKVRKAFSLAKDTPTAYIPSSKNACYHLKIDDIQLDLIQQDLLDYQII